jgi:hypothetical protein
MQSEKMRSSPANLSLTIPVNPVCWRDMMSTWRKHLIICLFLGCWRFPSTFSIWRPINREAAIGSHSISEGLSFWTYITLLAIHVTLSSIAVLSFPNSGALRIHVCSTVLSVILLGAGYFFYGKLLRAQVASGLSTNFDGDTLYRRRKADCVSET